MGCGRRENQGREDVRYDVWGEPGKEMAQVGYLIKYWVVPPEMRCSNRRAGRQPASPYPPKAHRDPLTTNPPDLRVSPRVPFHYQTLEPLLRPRVRDSVRYI